MSTKVLKVFKRGRPHLYKMRWLRSRLKVPDWIFIILLPVFVFIIFALIAIILSLIVLIITVIAIKVSFPLSLLLIFIGIISTLLFIIGGAHHTIAYWRAHKLISPRGNKLFLLTIYYSVISGIFMGLGII